MARTAGAFTIANAAGTVRPYSSGTDSFNFGPFNYYQAPDERWNVNAFAHYDATRRRASTPNSVFTTITARARSRRALTSAASNTLSFDNPLLSDQLKATFGITPTNPVDVVIQRRNIEGGPRIFDFRTTSYRGVGGVKGEIVDGWNYDAYYMLGRVIYSQVFRNDLSTSKFGRALDVITDPQQASPSADRRSTDLTRRACHGTSTASGVSRRRS